MNFWKDKTVLVTGHTGFKGGWLCLWLKELGAEVHGLALNPNTEPNLCDILDIPDVIDSEVRCDIRNSKRMGDMFDYVSPDVVFHLAAQPLVRESYRDPVYTFDVNVMGTVNVLAAIRNTESVRVGVMVTTDKVYENKEWLYPYREIDPLGGDDPYSASKAASEIVIDSYRKSFYKGINKNISSVRAGNVIGGGDWSEDRLVPDAVRAFTEKKPLILRNPDSVRPWQHVFDALYGYLRLVEVQWYDSTYSRAWNFGPQDTITVSHLADLLVSCWGDDATTYFPSASQETLHENVFLNLDSSQARYRLGWRPKLTMVHAVEKTVDWYKAFYNGEDMRLYSLNQIKEYVC